MALRGAIWDMDGVLVDTGELHYESWRAVLEEEGIPFSRELFARIFGMNNFGVLTAALGREPERAFYERLDDRKERLFREWLVDQVTPLPGALSWLERLGALGWKQAIGSSAPQANIDATLDALGIRGHFDAIVSGAGLPGKPNPDTFLLAAERIGVPPAECVVFEDAVAGVQAARRAGMACVAVTTTVPAERLAGADLVLARLNQLDEAALLRLRA